MKWEEFIKYVGNLPVIDTAILAAGLKNPASVKVQISRWQKSGKLIQIKRGIYLLGEAYRKVATYQLYIASVLKKPSYISLEKALEYHNLIPEGVSVYTSVTTKRPTRFTTKVGIFDYRHVKASLFWGYESVNVNRQTAFIASPEKALLDLIYLNGTKISSAYLKELRLQNLQKINLSKLFEYAKKFKKPGVMDAAKIINKHIKSYRNEEKTL